MRPSVCTLIIKAKNYHIGYCCQLKRLNKLRGFRRFLVFELENRTGRTDGQADGRARPVMRPVVKQHKPEHFRL